MLLLCSRASARRMQSRCSLSIVAASRWSCICRQWLKASAEKVLGRLRCLVRRLPRFFGRRGVYVLAKVLFPYTMLLTRSADDRITVPLIGIVFSRLPAYGLACGLYRPGFRSIGAAVLPWRMLRQPSRVSAVSCQTPAASKMRPGNSFKPTASRGAMQAARGALARIRSLPASRLNSGIRPLQSRTGECHGASSNRLCHWRLRPGVTLCRNLVDLFHGGTGTTKEPGCFLRGSDGARSSSGAHDRDRHQHLQHCGFRPFRFAADMAVASCKSETLSCGRRIDKRQLIIRSSPHRARLA